MVAFYIDLFYYGCNSSIVKKVCYTKGNPVWLLYLFLTLLD